MKMMVSVVAIFVAGLLLNINAAENNGPVTLNASGPGKYDINLNDEAAMTTVIVTQEMTIPKNRHTNVKASLLTHLKNRNWQNVGAVQVTKLADVGDKEKVLFSVSVPPKGEKGMRELLAVVAANPNAVGVLNVGTVYYKPVYRSALELAKKGEEKKSAIGDIVADLKTNQVTVTDDVGQVDCILSHMRAFDVPLKTVDVETTIVWVKKSAARRLGVDWGAFVRTLPTDMYTRHFTYDGGKTWGHEVGTNNWSPAAIGEFLNFMGSQEDVKLENKGRISVIPGEENRIGSETTVYQNMLVDGKPTTPGISAGTWLGMDAVVTEAQTTLVVDVNVGGFQNPTGGALTTAAYHQRSTIQVEPDKCYLMSGLTTTKEENSRVGVPGLKSIPGVRWLFSKEVTLKEEWEAMVFIRTLPKAVTQSAPVTKTVVAPTPAPVAPLKVVNMVLTAPPAVN